MDSRIDIAQFNRAVFLCGQVEIKKRLTNCVNLLIMIKEKGSEKEEYT